jgi:hypothetical protein
MKRFITISSKRAVGNLPNELEEYCLPASVLQSDGGNHFQMKVPLETRGAGVISPSQVAGSGFQLTTF